MGCFGRPLLQGYNQDAVQRGLPLELALEPAEKSPPMSDTALSSALLATPLAAAVAKSHPPSELSAYRGVLTHYCFDAPERETAALLSGVAVHDLGWQRRVAVRGEDRFRWLSGMVTNTVNDLAPNQGTWNLVLNAQGRIQGDLHVWRERDSLELEIAADQYERLLAHLDRFIIMDDVELAPMSLDSTGQLTGASPLGITGPSAAKLLKSLALPAPQEPLTSTRASWNGMSLCVARAYGVLVPHYELWAQAAEIPTLWRALTEAGAIPVGTGSLEALRIAEAVPAYGIDIAERDLPQETSQMRALHFNKGCYLGQEIVERIRSRGSVHRHLRPFELTGALPSLPVDLTGEDGAIAGHVTSAAPLTSSAGSRIFALGMIRSEAEIRNQPLNYVAGIETGRARILTAPPDLEPQRHTSNSESQKDG